MASLKGVNITRGKLGANVGGNADGICGLLASGRATSGIGLLQTVKLNSTGELEAIGIDEQYDADNSVCVYRHVSEYFRMAGDGATLYLMLYSGNTDGIFADGGAARRLIADAKGDIRCLALANTPAQDAEPASITALVQAAQQFYDWTFETFRPCQVVLEYNGFAAATAVAADNLRDLTVGSATLEAFKEVEDISSGKKKAKRYANASDLRKDLGV